MAVAPYNDGDLGSGGSASGTQGGAMPEGIGAVHGYNNPMSMKTSLQPLGGASPTRTDKAISSLIPPKLELSNG
jgi:hypothetical protein